METAIISGSKSAVTPWASRDEVRELGNRIKELLPGGQKLQSHEALALAQAALAHNLDPFNGEIWFIPKQGLMAGIKGHRRAGHNQMTREGGGNYWVEFVGPLSTDELAAYRIPVRALAFKARLFDSKNITTYTDAVAKLISAGAPWEAIQAMFGNRPYTEGIGFAMPDEPDQNCKVCHGTGNATNKWGDKCHCACSEESKMSQVGRAQKRAEADALKRRFDLPFTMAVGVNGDKDEVLAGDFTITSDDQVRMGEKLRRESGSRAMYGDDPGGDIASPTVKMSEVPEIPYSQATGQELGPEWTEPDSSKKQPDAPPATHKPAKEWDTKLLFQIVKAHKLTGGNKEAMGALNKSEFINPSDPEDIIMGWWERYFAYRKNGDEPDEAAKSADEFIKAQMDYAAQSAA